MWRKDNTDHSLGERRSLPNMRCLILVPSTDSVGGMQRRDRMLVKAVDTYVHSHCGALQVYALNDSWTDTAPADNQELHVAHMKCFRGDRKRFIFEAVRAFVHTDLVFYGLLGFAPLVFAQRILAPHSTSFLLLHGVEAWCKRPGLYTQAVRRMTGVVSISQYTLHRYRQVYDASDQQLGLVLPNCLSNQVFDKSRHSGDAITEAPAADGPRLLSVARLAAKEKYKGIDTVIESLPELLRAFPTLNYIVIGDGTDRPRLEQLTQRLGIADRVQFRGFVSEEDLQHEYAQCSAYVMPSAREGFGLVFLEAMAHGKPVVAARAGGAPEVVQDGVTGILVDFGDVAALTQAVKRLLEDADLRDRMGQTGLQRVRENYTYDIFCQRVAQILSEISRIQI